MGDAAEYILALETSNPSAGSAGVALGVASLHGAGARLLGVQALREQGRHDDDLLPAIDRLCREHSVGPGDLATVAVSVGPGGYTAVRIAVAAAKMIARGVGASCIAVPSALVAAWPHLKAGTERLGVALAGKEAGPQGGTAWVSIIRQGRETWAEDASHGQICGAAEIGSLGVSVLIADGFLPEGVRAAAVGAGVSLVESKFDAAVCLEIAGSGLLPRLTPEALQPLYPREPDAVLLWKARSIGSG